MIEGLTDRQFQLFLLFQTAIAQHKPVGLARLRDDDVADAAAALAATLETAARGVIYEHAAQSVPAQRLATDLKALLADVRQQGAKVFDGEAAAVLRAVEQGARNARRTADGDDVAYLMMMARLLERTSRARQPGDQTGGGGSLIVP
ncbi:MAG: hypothetical protein ACRD26_24625 [Vicinamibacterales bacterium]